MNLSKKVNLKCWIKSQGVFQWEVAEAVGVNECTMCRWLRRPEKLNQEVVEKIKAATLEIATKKRGGEVEKDTIYK